MKVLERLDISQNTLVGTLPKLWGLMSLVSLNLSGNSISGLAFPCIVAIMHRHTIGTKGPIPIPFRAGMVLRKAVHMASEMSSCKLFPPWACSAQCQCPRPCSTMCLPLPCALIPCHATGGLPADWLSPASTLSSTLSYLDLSGNKLTGSIPPAAGGRFATANSSDGLAAVAVLSPMAADGGMCGDIPSSMNVTSASGQRLQGTMPAGPCPGTCLLNCLPQQNGHPLIRRLLTGCITLSGHDAAHWSLKSGLLHSACEDPSQINCMDPFVGHRWNVELVRTMHDAGPQPTERTKVIIVAATVSAVLAALLAAAAVFAHLLLRSRRAPDNLKFSLSSLRKLGSSPHSNLSFVLDKNRNMVLLGRGGFGEVRPSSLPALEGRHPDWSASALPLNAGLMSSLVRSLLRVEGTLLKGWMLARAQVYKARWHGTLVAVKVLKSEDPSEAEAFLHEISILEGLHHLHVRCHDSAPLCSKS